MSSEHLDCGHTPEQHEQMDELHAMLHHMQMIENPRVALIIEESGEIHFATSIPPGEAALALEQMAARVRRYGGNYVRDHFDRGRSAQWN